MEKENKQSTNNAHLYGEIYGNVNINKIDTKRSAIRFTVDSVEIYKDAKGETQYKDSYNTVQIITDDKKLIKSFEKIAKDQENNKGVEASERVKHTASVDGSLVTRSYESDGETKYNTYVSADSVNLDVKKQENEVRNSVELTGNIAKVDVMDKFAVAQVATHFYRPVKEGEEGMKVVGKDGKEEIKPYVQDTSYTRIRISAERQPEFFEKLKSGEITGEKGKSAFVTLKGQMHNDNYEKDGKKVYAIVVDVASVKILEKKAEVKVAKAEEKKAEPAKKAAAAKKPVSKKKGVKLA